MTLHRRVQHLFYPGFCHKVVSIPREYPVFEVMIGNWFDIPPWCSLNLQHTLHCTPNDTHLRCDYLIRTKQTIIGIPIATNICVLQLLAACAPLNSVKSMLLIPRRIRHVNNVHRWVGCSFWWHFSFFTLAHYWILLHINHPAKVW